jgi:tetratricopeptide (TPR) repeat protein
VTPCNEFLTILCDIVPVINSNKTARDTPFKRLLELLSEILNVANPFLLIVDGIDECTTDSAPLHQYLFDLGHNPHAQIIVTSRDQLLLQKGDNNNFSQICLDQELVEPDIEHFVKEEIRRNPKFAKLQDDILELILERSHGIFLHAILLIEDLKRAKNVNEQKAKMAAFASKVPEEYQRLFADHDARLTPTECGRRDNILRLLIAAKTLFTVEQVSEALAFDDITQSLDKEDIDFEPAEEITKLCQPFVKVSDHYHVVFIHDSAREFLLQHHLTNHESNLFLARKCLSILTRKAYRDWRKAANLLRRHLLEGTIYETELQLSNEEEPALFEYAVLHFQDHVVALHDPPEDVVTKLAGFLLGVEFVVWSETVFDLRSQFGLGTQLAVYNQLLTWTKFLPAPIKVEIPIDDFYETAHVHLSRILEERSQDKLLPYLPQIRNAEYFNATGQSAQDWQKAYNNKKSIVMGFAEILGNESPVTLRFRTSLLQEYFWQKRFQEALEELTVVSDLQRKIVGEDVQDLYTTLWLLGCAYHDLNRFEEALSTFAEAATGLERLSGTSSRLYLMVGLYKGHTLEQLFRYDEAIILYENVSEVLVPVVGEGNGFVLMSRTAVGAIQRKQGRYGDAERNLLEGWGGRKKLFSINVNICLDAAVQLAMLYRDRGDGDKCLEVLDSVSDSVVYQQDFERLCQTKHIRHLVAFDNGAYERPKLELLLLLHEASGTTRNRNNRELLWVRITLADVMRQHGDEDEAAMLFSELVKPAEQDSSMLPEEPEPPMRLHLAEQALRLVRCARRSDAEELLRCNGLKWVRDEDFWILGEGGPVTDTGCIAPIGESTTRERHALRISTH